MAKGNLAQHIADALFAMEKHRVSEDLILFDRLGQKEKINLVSPDERKRFFLDLTRGRQSLIQISMQNREQQNDIILVRLDLNGPPHRNPGSRVFLHGPHLHLYREGFGDSWAEPAPIDIFSDLSNELITLREFMSFCNITRPPNIRLQGGLSI